MDLKAYAARAAARVNPSDQWFNEHPEARAQVDASLFDLPVAVITRWLKNEHQFPFSENVIDRLRAQRRDNA